MKFDSVFIALGSTLLFKAADCSDYDGTDVGNDSLLDASVTDGHRIDTSIIVAPPSIRKMKTFEIQQAHIPLGFINNMKCLVLDDDYDGEVSNSLNAPSKCFEGIPTETQDFAATLLKAGHGTKSVSVVAIASINFLSNVYKNTKASTVDAEDNESWYLLQVELESLFSGLVFALGNVHAADGDEEGVKAAFKESFAELLDWADFNHDCSRVFSRSSLEQFLEAIITTSPDLLNSNDQRAQLSHSLNVLKSTIEDMFPEEILDAIENILIESEAIVTDFALQYDSLPPFIERIRDFLFRSYLNTREAGSSIHAHKSLFFPSWYSSQQSVDAVMKKESKKLKSFIRMLDFIENVLARAVRFPTWHSVTISLLQFIFRLAESFYQFTHPHEPKGAFDELFASHGYDADIVAKDQHLKPESHAVRPSKTIFSRLFKGRTGEEDAEEDGVDVSEHNFMYDEAFPCPSDEEEERFEIDELAYGNLMIEFTKARKGTKKPLAEVSESKSVESKYSESAAVERMGRDILSSAANSAGQTLSDETLGPDVRQQILQDLLAQLQQQNPKLFSSQAQQEAATLFQAATEQDQLPSLTGANVINYLKTSSLPKLINNLIKGKTGIDCLKSLALALKVLNEFAGMLETILSILLHVIRMVRKYALSASEVVAAMAEDHPELVSDLSVEVPKVKDSKLRAMNKLFQKGIKSVAATAGKKLDPFNESLALAVRTARNHAALFRETPSRLLLQLFHTVFNEMESSAGVIRVAFTRKQHKSISSLKKAAKDAVEQVCAAIIESNEEYSNYFHSELMESTVEILLALIEPCSFDPISLNTHFTLITSWMKPFLQTMNEDAQISALNYLLSDPEAEGALRLSQILPESSHYFSSLLQSERSES